MELNELIKALKSMLPEKVPYGDLIGAEGVYAHSGPLVYADPEPYFIEQAAAELKKLSEIQDILGPIYDTDHLRELIQADKDERVIIPPMAYGDTVYRITRCGNIPPVLDGTMYDGDGGLGTATGLYCPYGLSETCPFSCEEDGSFFCENHKDELAIFEDRVKEICITETGDYMVFECCECASFCDFGKTVFGTRKEAEAALAKMKEAAHE